MTIFATENETWKGTLIVSESDLFYHVLLLVMINLFTQKHALSTMFTNVHPTLQGCHNSWTIWSIWSGAWSVSYYFIWLDASTYVGHNWCKSNESNDWNGMKMVKISCLQPDLRADDVGGGNDNRGGRGPSRVQAHSGAGCWPGKTLFGDSRFLILAAN